MRLGGERGTAVLHIDPLRDDIASLAGFGETYLRANTTARPTKAIQCEVRTLDDLCMQHGIPEIDLLKVDVEGFEFEVLGGAATMLARTKAIVVELSLIRQGSGDDAIEQMLRLLRSAGFCLVDLLPSYYDPRNQWRPLEFNVIARRSVQITSLPDPSKTPALPADIACVRICFGEARCAVHAQFAAPRPPFDEQPTSHCHRCCFSAARDPRSRLPQMRKPLRHMASTVGAGVGGQQGL